jgi:hypothetical protein
MMATITLSYERQEHFAAWELFHLDLGNGKEFAVI